MQGIQAKLSPGKVLLPWVSDVQGGVASEASNERIAEPGT